MNRKQEMIENWSWRLASEGKDFPQLFQLTLPNGYVTLHHL